MPANVAHTTPQQWATWIDAYGPEKFFESFVQIAQDCESTCVHCSCRIYLDIVEGGGCPDWRDSDGDYGCFQSPDTNEEGTGSHVPYKLTR